MAAGGAWAALCEKFRSAQSLSAVESKKDPETEPYRSKYGARQLLQEIKQLLGPEEAAEAEAGAAAALRAVRLAALEYELGVNHTETEELSAGEEHLLKCTRLLEPRRLSRACVSLYIQAQVGTGVSPASSPGPNRCPARGGRARQACAVAPCSAAPQSPALGLGPRWHRAWGGC